MRLSHLLRPFIPTACLTLLACGDTSGPGGTLEVTTLTTGDAGAGSYTIGLDGGTPRPIGPTATRQFSDVEAGEHQVLLGGVPDHCTASGENLRTVTVTAGQTAGIQFEVACSATGTLLITTPTTGESRDPNGYQLSVSGLASTRVETEATTTLKVVAPGEYTVTVDDIAPNCTVSQGGTREVSVTVGTRQSVTFDVVCSFAGAVRWDTIPLPLGFNSSFTSGKSIWGTSPSNLFVIGDSVGRGASILHYDGQGWTEQAGYRDIGLVAIAGASGTDVFVIGNRSNGSTNEGLILHYDGSRWSEMAGPVVEDPTKVRYNDIWRAASGEFLLVGTYDGTELLARFDGVTWSRMQVPDLGVRGAVRHVSGTSSTDVWTIDWELNCTDCGSTTSYIGHWNGVESSVHRPPFGVERSQRDTCVRPQRRMGGGSGLRQHRLCKCRPLGWSKLDRRAACSGRHVPLSLVGCLGELEFRPLRRRIWDLAPL
jgi:hypothetical protein